VRARIAIAAVLALGGVIFASGDARAQNAAAELLFRDGDQLMGEGNLAEACAAFQASNRIEPRAGTLIRLGDCREKNHQLASAWSAYVDAVARVKDPGKAQIATSKVRALEPRLSKLTIVVHGPVDALAITRDGTAIDGALLGRAVPTDGGTYAIRASADGYEAWETKITVPEEAGAVTVDVPALVAVPRAARPTVGANDRTPRPRAGATGMSGKRKAAIGFGVVGVLAIGGGVALGLDARGLEDEAAGICPAITCTRADEANTTLDRARNRALLSNVAYGAGGVAVVTGAVLWIVGGKRVREADIAFVPTARGAAVVGRF